jgi:hypothetical protein
MSTTKRKNVKASKLAERRAWILVTRLNGAAHELPLLSGVPLARVLELHREEPTAFDQYRTALPSVLTEYVEKQKPVSSVSAKKIYDERIHPELLALKRRIEAYRKSLLKKSVTSAMVAGALAAVGIAAKPTPAELGVLGTGSLVTSLTGLLGDATEAPADVKNQSTLLSGKAIRVNRHLTRIPTLTFASKH